MADGKPVGHLESPVCRRENNRAALRLVTGILVKDWTALASSFPTPCPAWQE
jgi:hypothetical protein